MNNKVVNLALLAENAGKLDKSKTNINNLFMEIKKIVDYSQGDIANIKIIKDYYKIDLKTAKELWDSIREQENQ